MVSLTPPPPQNVYSPKSYTPPRNLSPPQGLVSVLPKSVTLFSHVQADGTY